MRFASLFLSIIFLAISYSSAEAQEPPVKQKSDVVACATCGCSELCPIAMVETSGKSRDASILSSSIWGNMILKIAYDRDEQMQRLAKKLKITNSVTTSSIGALAGGTLGQGALSMVCLNPPDGLEDSYAPGIVGLSLNAATNIAFNARMLLNYKFHKQYQARQREIKRKVESVLTDLENTSGGSKDDYDNAKSELISLIGNHATDDCLQLWKSSHQQLAGKPQNISMLDANKH